MEIRDGSSASGQSPNHEGRVSSDGTRSGNPWRVAIADLLSVELPFCRACGSDYQTSADVCPGCGQSTATLPRRLDGRLGLVYSLRRGLRKRRAVCVAETDGLATLLFESGETSAIAPEELPEPEPMADERNAVELRTSAARLLQLSVACRDGSSKRKWDPDSLQSAALDAIEDDQDARLLAADAVELGCASLLERIDLGESERAWLLAVSAARGGDRAELLVAIARLPHDGYRHKLGLLASNIASLRPPGSDRALLAAHLRPYLGSEPLAGLLARTLELEQSDGMTDAAVDQALAEERQLAERIPLPADAAREARLALELLSGAAPDPGPRPAGLGTSLRTLLALRDSSPGLIGPPDIDQLPMPLLDDLIDSGAVEGEMVIAGSTDIHRTRYLLARLAPGRLSDADVDQLAHNDEKVRRAFRYGDPQALEALGDSPIVAHYRALLSLASDTGQQDPLQAVLPAAREVVADLLRFRSTKSEHGSFSDVLTARLVADPTIWPSLVEIAGPTGLRPSDELRDRFPAFTEWLALHQAREHLFLGEWHSAVHAADACLALAKAEAVRDEALNLKACGLHNLGEDARALGALEEAVQGERSEALLANVGIVAAGLDPEIAAKHLGVLMEEAPTLALRVAAARRALDIWAVAGTESWRNSDDSPLPDAFQEPLRRLLVAPLECSDFRDLVRVLAKHDSAWLLQPTSLAGSPHEDSLEARFYLAQADNITRMIAVMGESMARGSAPEWVIRERDSLRAAAVEILFDNLDEPDSTFGSIALAMVDHRVLADQQDVVLLTALGVAGVSYHLSVREEEVADRIVALVTSLRADWQQLEGEDRDRIEPLVELATRRVAINRMSSRGRDFDEAVDLFNSAIDLGERADPGSAAYAEALRRCQRTADACGEIRQELRRWVPIVDHEGVRGDLNKLIEMTRELENRCMEILN